MTGHQHLINLKSRLGRSTSQIAIEDRATCTSRQHAGVLCRLLRDESGNTLAIMAAAMFPIAGMIGGGLDISRAYLAKTRLQNACDAGVLAGRRVMSSGGTITTAVTQEVQKYVNFNFPQGNYDSSAFTITPTLGTDDQIQLSLSTQVSTSVMRLFGKTSMDVVVNCSARNDYANIDIVLVLDTTGSMACKPERDGDNCSSWINNNNRGGKTMTVDGKTVTYVQEETSGATNISRMQGLRNAIDTLQAQISTIETQFNAAPSGTRKRVRWSIVPFSQMTNPGFSRGSAGTTLYSRNPTWFNTSGSYRNVVINQGAYVVTGPTTIAHNATWMSNTWDGCVEERATSNSITPSSGYSIPNNLPGAAYDLKFDLAPSSTETRWTVADESATGTSQYACPKYMRELAPMTNAEIDDYFAFNRGFIANGGTYLDLGLLWAARFLSRSGMWASENPLTYNTFPVARYVILMTDGEMDTGNVGYGAYGQEKWWKRITSDGAVNTSNDNHEQRMLMTCAAIKNMDAKIYAISFGSGSTLSAAMQGCSSGAGFGYKADNSAQLNQAFRDIGENIGSLRLSQ